MRSVLAGPQTIIMRQRGTPHNVTWFDGSRVLRASKEIRKEGRKFQCGTMRPDLILRSGVTGLDIA